MMFARKANKVGQRRGGEAGSRKEEDGGGFDEVTAVRRKERASMWSIACFESLAVIDGINSAYRWSCYAVLGDLRRSVA